MTSSYIIAGCRTPIGKYQKALASLPASGLGAIAVKEALRRAGVEPGRVDEVIMGNVLSAGVGQAPARQAALGAGLPPTVAALTINKVCGSGLKAVMLADQAIRAGDAQCIVAGGMESMSRAPFLVRKGSDGKAVADVTPVDSMLFDGLTCAFENVPMGSEAEFIAGKYGISRDDQDAFALESHRRAVAAWERGDFASEIVPVHVKSADGGEVVINRDEGPRGDTSLAALAKLRTPFAENGTVTPGNSSQISDGAAAVVVGSEEFVARMDRRDSQIRARIVATATSGVTPKELFIAPVSAIEKVLAKAKLTLGDIDLVELNEAFAAQCLACMRPLGLDASKVNLNGGAIALGHPIGASGARVLVTLLYALERRQLRRGLAALCLGGGNAVAMIVERKS
jgi:acetyl-CoA C-acetyltransferase